MFLCDILPNTLPDNRPIQAITFELPEIPPLYAQPLSKIQNYPNTYFCILYIKCFFDSKTIGYLVVRW